MDPISIIGVWEKTVPQEEEWVTAKEALALLPLPGYSGKRAICKRAHAQLIKARAKRFIHGGRASDDTEIPASFWWAEGESALTQNWTTGDFDTWVNNGVLHLEAFGVEFLCSDVEAMRPPSVTKRDLLTPDAAGSGPLTPSSVASNFLASRAEAGGNDVKPVTRKVFIGHGRSAVWLELKIFLQERLGLTVVEFNSTSPAGVATLERLKEMLDAVNFAFLILTGEDEQADGRLNPRLNVAHEAGLFQGKLGFTKAIVLLEDGCQDFSNVHGLGEIRFPKGKISAEFEEVRRVLEREKLVL
jgi:Predicted nucleotide-binding protein containing TIR-like domain